MRLHIFLLPFLLAPTLTLAQAPPELKALATKAMERSITVRQGILQEQASALRTKDAQAGYLPTVNVTAGYTYLNPVSKATFGAPIVSDQGLVIGQRFNTLQFVPYHNWSSQLNINQTVLDFGRTKTAISRALEEEAQAKTTTESFRHAIAYQTAQVYYGILFLNQSISVQDTVLASLGENRRVIENKIRNGEAIDLDRLNTQSLIDQTVNRKTDLQNQLSRQYASLRYLVGTDAQAINTGAFNFKLTDTAGLARGGANYDVRLAAQRLAVARKAETITGRAFYPTLTASALGGVKNGYQPDIDKGRGNFAVSLNLNIPLYTGGRTERGRQLAAANTAVAQAQQEGAQLAYERDLANALADRDGALIKQRNALSQTQQALRGYTLAQSRYRNGIATNLDVLNSNDLYQQARLAQIQTDYQLALAELELARLAGVRFW